MSEDFGRPSLVIEMLGIPGAGKTTLVQKLLAELRLINVPIWGLKSLSQKVAEDRCIPSLIDAAKVFVPLSLQWRLLGPYYKKIDILLEQKASKFDDRHPGFTDWIRTLFRSNDREKDLWAFRFTRKFIGRYQLLCDEIPSVPALIIDEGFLQRGISFISLYGIEHPLDLDKEVDKLLSLIPLPDAVLWVGIPPGLALTRMKNRSKSLARRIENLTQSAQFKAFDNFEACSEMANKTLRRRGVKIMRVNNELEQEEMEAHIAQLVSQVSQMIR